MAAGARQRRPHQYRCDALGGFERGGDQWLAVAVQKGALTVVFGVPDPQLLPEITERRDRQHINTIVQGRTPHRQQGAQGFAVQRTGRLLAGLHMARGAGLRLAGFAYVVSSSSFRGAGLA